MSGQVGIRSGWYQVRLVSGQVGIRSGWYQVRSTACMIILTAHSHLHGVEVPWSACYVSWLAVCVRAWVGACVRACVCDVTLK